MSIRSTSRPIALVAVLLVACATLFVSACSGSSSSSSSFQQKDLTVSNVWARESVGSTDIGVVYFTIENSSAIPDKLFSASVPQSFAKSASLHETTVTDGTTSTTMAMGSMNSMGSMDSMSSTTMGSGSPELLSMKDVASVTIPANGSVTLEPGGFHVMVTGLAAPLKVGQKFDLNLGFLNAGVIKVTAVVKAS